VVGPDGCIWGIPSKADYLLRIDPRSDEATTVGNLPSTRDKWQVILRARWVTLRARWVTLSSLGDAKSSLGDATSSLGDAKSSLGDV
jgi:hypothetical protein